VVESVGQDFWYFLFTAALDILSASGFDERVVGGTCKIKTGIGLIPEMIRRTLCVTRYTERVSQ
jgi:hypothetical protein